VDSVVRNLADYATGVAFETLPPEVVRACKRHFVDTIGCALGAYASEPARIARELALRVQAPRGARLLGTVRRTLPELAAFANGVMARCLEGNDVFPGSGHPSDAIGGILAAADAGGANGKAVIGAMVISYDIYHHLSRALDLRNRGWDYSYYVAVASAAGAGRLLGLDARRMAEAIAIATTPNLALGATRRGQLSLWKGCAGGDGARNGVFAALLAAAGMTGPEKPVEGEHGLRQQLGRCDFTPLDPVRPSYCIRQANLKPHLAEYHSLLPIALALELQPRVKWEEIEAITIHTYRFTWQETGSEPEKWHPTTRETADHSLPWTIAAVMIDGRFSDEIFSESRLKDPRVHRLADRITVKEDPEFTRRYPAELPCRIEVATRANTLAATGDIPPGHHRKPLGDEAVSAKFRDLAQRALPRPRVDGALALLWKLDEAPDFDPFFAALAVDGSG